MSGTVVDCCSVVNVLCLQFYIGGSDKNCGRVAPTVLIDEVVERCGELRHDSKVHEHMFERQVFSTVDVSVKPAV